MKIAIIGAGAMGGAIAEGLIKDDEQLNEDISLSNPTAAKLEPFAKEGVSVTTSNVACAHGADIVCVVVKPWIVKDVLNEICPELDFKKQILVVVAAGVAGKDLIEWSTIGDEHPSIVLAMPNTAIAVRQSMTFLVSPGAPAADMLKVQTLFDRLGGTMVVEERQLSAGCALASCGIAYAMRYVRAASEGGVELGFKADAAKDIVLHTMMGAASLLLSTGNHPEAEIDKVTTPGGLTIRGLNAMEQHGFTTAVIEGLKASL